MFKQGTIVDATISAVPSSTKNSQDVSDPERHQTTVATSANVADVEVVDDLMQGRETMIFADAGYTGAEKRFPRTWVA